MVADMIAKGSRPGDFRALVASALFKRQVERIAMPNQRLFTDEPRRWRG